jgi:hypothetical protein
MALNLIDTLDDDLDDLDNDLDDLDNVLDNNDNNDNNDNEPLELDNTFDIEDGDLLMYNKEIDTQKYCVSSVLKCSDENLELKETVSILEFLKSLLQKEVLNNSEIKAVSTNESTKEINNKLAFLKTVYNKFLVLPKKNNNTSDENTQNTQYTEYKSSNEDLVSLTKIMYPDKWMEGLVKYHRSFNTFKECEKYSEQSVGLYRKYYRRVETEGNDTKYEVVSFSEYSSIDESDPNVIFRDFEYNEDITPIYQPYNGQWYPFNPDPSLIKNQKTPDVAYNNMNTAYHRNQEEVEVKKKELDAKTKLEKKYKKNSNRRLVNKKK